MSWILLRNSLLTAGATTVLAVFCGGASALLYSGMGRFGRAFLLSAALLTLALPPFLVTNTWLHLLGFTGVWRTWLPFDIYSLGGSVWIMTWMYWPIALLLAAGSFQQLQPEQLESTPELRGWPLVRRLLLPISRPALAQAALLIFVLALNNFAVPSLLQTKVYTEEIWVRFNTTFDYGKTLAASWPLLLVPLFLLWAVKPGAYSWPRLQPAVSPALFRQQFGTSGFVLASVTAGCAILFSLLIPLVQLLGDAKTWREFSPAVAAGWNAILHSAVIPVLAATLCLGLAFWFRRLRVQMLLWVIYLLPGVLLGMLFIKVFNQSWFRFFYQSLGIVILGFTIRYAAVAWQAMNNASEALDPDLLDFARLHGAGRWNLFRHIILPQAGPALAGGWYIIYLLALWDVETLILIVPPGAETVALRAFNMLHYGHNSQVNALCVVLLVIAVLPLLLWNLAKLGTAFVSSRSRIGLTLLSLVFLTSCSPRAENQVSSLLFDRVQIIGSRGTGAGQFNKPRSVAVDRADNIYVVDMTGRVQKFSPAGQFVRSWQMPETDKGKPKGMALDSDGNIIVIEPHYGRVNHFSADGELRGQWGMNGTNSGNLMFPRAVAVSSCGDLFVSEYGLVERVQHFVRGGARFVASVGQRGEKPGEFNRPEGLGMDAADRLYVADSCNHRIQVFSPEGKFLREFGKAGAGPGEMSYPYDVRVDLEGHEFVCEFGNSRIQVFDSRDQPLETLGGTGADPGKLFNPWAIALDSQGNLLVADSGNHRLVKYFRKP